MAVAYLRNVVIFDEHLYRPTGLVGKWMTKVTARFVAEAIKAAPMDTGQLKAGISGGSHQIAPKMVQGRISSSAPHTMWVIRGTGFPVKGHGGSIYSTKGFVTRNREDAYTTLWGTQARGGKFSRKGRGGPGDRRRQIRVRKSGYWLKLPFPSRSGGPVFAFSVRGQEPNNFLFTAWNRTARTHSAIKRNRASFPSGLL